MQSVGLVYLHRPWSRPPKTTREQICAELTLQMQRLRQPHYCNQRGLLVPKPLPLEFPCDVCVSA